MTKKKRVMMMITETETSNRGFEACMVLKLDATSSSRTLGNTAATLMVLLSYGLDRTGMRELSAAARVYVD
jgi:hypothetical protein